MKMYPGNEPNESEGWEYLQSFKIDDINWLLFEKRQEHSQTWFNYKIAAEGSAPRKANYWCAFNKETGHTAFNKDLGAMKEHRPELYKAFMGSIQD